MLSVQNQLIDILRIYLSILSVELWQQLLII